MSSDIDVDPLTVILDGDPVIDETTVEVLPDFLATHDALTDGPDA